jgi:hypothetical protein
VLAHQGAVIVAVCAVRVMEMPIDDVVGVIAMQHGIVPAARPMGVGLLVSPARVRRGALRGICPAHADDMLME